MKAKDTQQKDTTVMKAKDAVEITPPETAVEGGKRFCSECPGSRVVA